MGGALALFLFVMLACLSFSGDKPQGERWPLRKSALFLLCLAVVAVVISAVVTWLR
jgi:cytochrome c oxidase assembly factor CtaG